MRNINCDSSIKGNRNLAILYVCVLYSDSFKRAHRERDKDGCTPLLTAAKCGDQDTFSCLLEHVSQLVVSGIKRIVCV